MSVPRARIMNLMVRLRPSFLLALSFCATAAFAAPQPLLITAQQLNEKLDSVVLLDARANDKYEAGHLPDAISLPWIDLSDMPKSPKMSSDADVLRILRSKGVPSNAQVVIYGDAASGWGEEGRLFWTLAYLGHKRASILNGGTEAWKKAGFALDTVGPLIDERPFKPKPVAKFRVDLQQLRAMVASKKPPQLLDVRDRDEFDGARKYNEARGGRIPGARNLSWKQLLAKDGTVLPPDEIDKLLAGVGIKKAQPVIVYCTGGVRSGFAFFALRHAGYNVANYDGSFFEWAGTPEVPVETASGAGQSGGR